VPCAPPPPRIFTLARTSTTATSCPLPEAPRPPPPPLPLPPRLSPWLWLWRGYALLLCVGVPRWPPVTNARVSWMTIGVVSSDMAVTPRSNMYSWQGDERARGEGSAAWVSCRLGAGMRAAASSPCLSRGRRGGAREEGAPGGPPPGAAAASPSQAAAAAGAPLRARRSQTPRRAPSRAPRPMRRGAGRRAPARWRRRRAP
jgi:hypothetical protein